MPKDPKPAAAPSSIATAPELLALGKLVRQWVREKYGNAASFERLDQVAGRGKAAGSRD